MLNGIVVVNKPRGVTSSDCVYKLRKILQIRKIGHAGTLDPEVNGVLPIAIGQATKLIELMHEKPKSYIGSGMFGRATDSYDLDGTTTAEEKIVTPFTSDEIISGMKKLTGKIDQVPPIYSAVRVNGKRLYEYARNDIYVKLPVREVEVFEIELISDIVDNEFSFRCRVSKGTYIRSLIRDIGYELGNCATMVELKRIKQGMFDINEAYSLKDIENDNYKILNPIDVLDIPKVVVSEDMEFRVINGQVLKKFFAGDIAMILNKNNELLAIYKDYNDGYVKPYKMFV